MSHLMVDYNNFAIIIIFGCFLIFVSYLFLNKFIEKLLIIIAITMCTFFSGVGIFTNFTDNTEYLISFLIFMFFLVVPLSIIVKSNLFVAKKNYDEIFTDFKRLFIVLGILALLTHFAKLLYPEFRLFDIFQFNRYHFSNDTFIVRLEQRNDPIYSFLNSLSIIMLPFYFIFLYSLRKKPFLFILFIMLYPYISFVQTGYVGRTEMFLWLSIILIYFYSENIIKKRTLFIIILVTLIFLIPVMNFLFYYRQGIDVGKFSFSETLNDFLRQESISQSYLYITELFAGQLNFLEMIERWLFNMVPFYPDNNFPVLSYIFSTAITGIEYGGRNFYILLPSAFGEGIMMLGKSGTWIYALFIAIFCGVIINAMKNIKFLRYWNVFFVLNFGMAFRGGFQTFFSQYFYTTLILFLVMFLMRFISEKNV